MFKPGQSGNPKGKTPGRVKTAQGICTMIAEYADEIIRTIIEAARGGDMLAAKLLIELICPSLKPAEAPLPQLPDGSLAVRFSAITAKLASGELFLGDGARLVDVLLKAAKAEDDARFDELLHGCPEPIWPRHSEEERTLRRGHGRQCRCID